jgi:hypothetical protein
MRITRYFQYAFWICTLIAAVGLGGRLWSIAAHTETGYQSLGAPWWNATFGLVWDSQQNIGFRPPAEQAQYWLQETERILRDHPGDAALAMGAAWMLDAPDPSFRFRHLRVIHRIGGSSFPEIDESGIKNAEAEFEDLCRDQCLEFGRKATDLDSSNVNWWRMRALLVFNESLSSTQSPPRDTQWRSVLDECARRDPDNALYDYLAANWLWNHSAREDLSGSEFFMVIDDEQRFEEGISHFDRGQAKPFLAISDDGFTAAAAFLCESRQPRSGHVNLVNNRCIRYRTTGILRSLWQWQNYRAQAAAKDGQIDQALDLHQQNIQVLEQHAQAGSSMAYDTVPLYLMVSTADAMQNLAIEHPQAVEEVTKDRILRQRRQALVRREVVRRAALLLPQNRPRVVGQWPRPGDTIVLVAAIAAAVLPRTMLLLLAFGIAAFLATRWLQAKNIRSVGLLGHSVAVVAALSTTTVFLGLCPAEIISPTVQAWVFSFLLVVMPILVTALFVWRSVRKRRFRFSMRAMMLSVLALCLILGLLSLLGFPRNIEVDFPFELAVPARAGDFAPLPSSWLVEKFRNADLGWFMAFIQWAAYGGQYWTILPWIMLIGFISLWHTKQLPCHGVPLSRRYRLAAVCRALGKPALVMAALLILTYLVAAAHTLTVIEDTFQEGIAFARSPQEYWARVEAVVRSVETDDVQMKAITDWAEKEVLVGPQRTTDSGEDE